VKKKGDHGSREAQAHHTTCAHHAFRGRNGRTGDSVSSQEIEGRKNTKNQADKKSQVESDFETRSGWDEAGSTARRMKKAWKGSGRFLPNWERGDRSMKGKGRRGKRGPRRRRKRFWPDRTPGYLEKNVRGN